MEKIIARINELSRKNKSAGLTEDEIAERDSLRRQYIAIFKGNFKQQLDSIEWTDDKPPSLPH
ncbi:DUF896 domain-containing protein [Cohnella faecalis]|uniref:UPF0291 protein D3H35_04640 n=2 Tax=Cohnella faecalis TaxID=2315694 RepID=A0A398D0A0_9BACL|nr:DUF896 domain-containing protein [Cohnella faecalis]RIE04901.1 DUF896 domain-containing protein [Cohnella faecalis]